MNRFFKRIFGRIIRAIFGRRFFELLKEGVFKTLYRLKEAMIDKVLVWAEDKIWNVCFDRNLDKFVAACDAEGVDWRPFMLNLCDTEEERMILAEDLEIINEYLEYKASLI